MVGRRVGAKVLLVLGCLLLLLANVVVWARLTALDTDRFVRALGPLADDRELDEGLATELTDRILTEVDVEARIESVLSADNALVTAAVTQLARGLVRDALTDVLGSDAFREIWTEALRQVHERALQVIDGADGSIALQLTDLLDRADSLLQDRGLDVLDRRTIDRIDDIVVTRSDQVQTVSRAVDLLRRLAVILPIAAVVALGLALLLAPDRRHMLGLLGAGVAVAMVVTAVALRIGRRVLFDQVGGDVQRRAAEDVWSGVLTPLFRQTAVFLVLGLVVAVGAWLVGPATSAVRVRSWFGIRPHAARAEADAEAATATGGRVPSPVAAALAPRLRVVQAGVGVLGAAVLLLLPTLSLSTVVVVVALAVVAVVVLELVAGRGGTGEGRSSGGGGARPSPTPGVAHP